MSNYQYGDKQTPQGRENSTSQVRLGQEGCNGLHHGGSGQIPGSAVQHSWGQPERVGGDVCQGDYYPRGGEIVGGTLSQLVEDAKEQIAGNNKVINSLQEVNGLLEQRILHYQQMLSQIQD